MKAFINSLKMLVIMIIITGILYPCFVTLTGKLLFNKKVRGSLVEVNGVVVGSELIGQNFSEDKYFVGRPSVVEYKSISGGASNKSVTDKTYQETLKNRYDELSKKFNIKDLPRELYTASGSGLDPHISKEGALVQLDSVAKARSFDHSKKEKLWELINNLTEKRSFGILGEERINVLKLNIALDKLALQ